MGYGETITERVEALPCVSRTVRMQEPAAAGVALNDCVFGASATVTIPVQAVASTENVPA